MGGPTLAERLTDERPDLKVLFVSGYAENTVLKHGTIDVATRFLQKPFSLKTLARKVREVLEASEASALATSSRGWGGWLRVRLKLASRGRVRPRLR
jgi:FixJ family two-component response regulator